MVRFTELPGAPPPGPLPGPHHIPTGTQVIPYNFIFLFWPPTTKFMAWALIKFTIQYITLNYKTETIPKGAKENDYHVAIT